MAKNVGNLVGSWAFLIGVIVALIFGAMGQLNSAVIITLIVIGLIVGFLNVAGKEVQPFLLSGAVLLIAAYYGRDVMGQISVVSDILQAMLAIFVPATIIVAIKNVFSLARN